MSEPTQTTLPLITVLGEGAVLALAVIMFIATYPIVGPIFWEHEWGPLVLWFHYFIGNMFFVLGIGLFGLAALGMVEGALTFLAHLFALVEEYARAK